MTTFSYRIATDNDLPLLTDVYNASVMQGGASADTEAVSLEARRAWLHGHVDPYAVFIIEADVDGVSQDIGFAALSRFHARPGYNGICTVAYYLTPQWQGKGAGKAIMQFLLDECAARGMRKAIGMIFADNVRSIALVNRFNFTQFGLLPQAALDARGIMHDMSYWYLDI